MIESVKPVDYTAQMPQAGDPLQGSIVTKPKPVYESGPATLPGRVYPSTDTGIYRDRSNSWVVDVLVKDPITSREIVLQGVRLEQNSQGLIQKINKTGTLYVSMPDQRALGERDISVMTAKWLDTNVGTENSAVPMSMIFNSYRNKISSAAARFCDVSKFDYEKEAKNLHKIEGLTVVADPTNPKSSGMAYDTTTGRTAIFNKHQQNMTFDKDGISVDAKKFNRGGSNQTKNGLGTLGLPGSENEMQDLYPRSNILLNVPMIVPPYLVEFMMILYGVAFLYKIVRIGQVAADFIQDNDD